jgi:hypothetical protein
MAHSMCSDVGGMLAGSVRWLIALLAAMLLVDGWL